MNTDLLSLFDADEASVQAMLRETLKGADDGELFLEHAQAESRSFDNGRLKTATYDVNQGFGLRAVAGEAVGYAHADDLSEKALRRAADAVKAVSSGHSGMLAEPPRPTNRKLYGDVNPLLSPAFSDKVALLSEIDAWARARDPRVRQVTASITTSHKIVEIIRADGIHLRDVRPLVRVNVSLIAGSGDRQESGSYGEGGRLALDGFITPERWHHAVDEALRQALVNLEAKPAPAGTFDVVLGPGWTGVLLHEAVGHGLEGDFNRKKTSAFAGLMGEQVAAKGVTIRHWLQPKRIIARDGKVAGIELDYTRAVGEQEVVVKYKGNNYFKSAVATVRVNIVQPNPNNPWLIAGVAGIIGAIVIILAILGVVVFRKKHQEKVQ